MQDCVHAQFQDCTTNIHVGHTGVAMCVALQPKCCLCFISFFFCWSSWTFINAAVSYLVAKGMPVSQAVAGVGLSNTCCDVSLCVGLSSGPGQGLYVSLAAAYVATGQYPRGLEQ